MAKILISLILDWRFILALVVFIVVMTVLFYKSEGLTIMRIERKRKPVIKKQPEAKVQNDEPGKLYVPNSTYEILKKEGLIHSPEEK